MTKKLNNSSGSFGGMFGGEELPLCPKHSVTDVINTRSLIQRTPSEGTVTRRLNREESRSLEFYIKPDMLDHVEPTSTFLGAGLQNLVSPPQS